MRPPRRLPHLTSDDINPDTRPNPADCTSSSIIDTTENTKRDLEDISSEPLDLDMESELLDAFLNLINSSHPYVHQLSFQHSSELPGQCDKLICNLDICNAVKQRLYEWGVTMPWELLVLASERDDVNMGRIALKSMDSSIFINEMSWYNFRATPQEMIPLRSRPFWERMGMLSPSWQIELIKLTFEGPIRKHVSPNPDKTLYLGHTEPQTVMLLRKDWDCDRDKFAQSFNP
ncbi:hypothetical protein I203_106201 [Kwoniella mangroviensis CBS 8507]|uniref:uncharacterized protein n=1 Tax=Kwoniella mangroviensis CBS 8507 TaxID=1296122 RepID=UPI00080D63EC|nr:uncharacterized protein I203_04675 [Kwoniella mangroviensis CBS 8507]OCF66344.1 hypothetical protein I203_04675 [Kwoniella mangroviensis CBS 8507]